MATWRLLDLDPLPASQNLALDEALLEARSLGASPNTLRFLQFSPRAALVGYHQSVEQEVRVDYCHSHGIEVNRRITGGGAIFFDESQLGWELIASRADLGVGRVVTSLFARLCSCTIAGLDTLGVRATFRPKNDIEVDGRKISGTGGTEEGDAFLFQGTLLVDFDVETMLRALRIPLEKLRDKEIDSLKERVTCLKWELGHVPPLDQIKRAMKEGFERILGVTLVPGGLNDTERRLLEEKQPKFRSSNWIHGSRVPVAEEHLLRSARKTPGGLIRVSLVYEAQKRRIKSILITGDFFAFPKRTILDLEAALKGVGIGLVEEKVRGFFAQYNPQIPGIGADDFVLAIEEALDRLQGLQYEIPACALNRVYPVNGSLNSVMQRDISLMLLPYCAKLLGCSYRHSKECVECDGCSVSEPYRWAREMEMRAETIVNYEDLEATLRQAKTEGVQAFLGCCCEAFYIKHRPDFERVGLPGVLVDVDSTTCYDLGEEERAYGGLFESQTELNLELVRALMAAIGARRPQKAVAVAG